MHISFVSTSNRVSPSHGPLWKHMIRSILSLSIVSPQHIHPFICTHFSLKTNNMHIPTHNCSILQQEFAMFEKKTGYRSDHYSYRFTLLKLFIPRLLVRKNLISVHDTLMVPDDDTFFIKPIPAVKTPNITLICKFDPRRCSSNTYRQYGMCRDDNKFCHGSLYVVNASFAFEFVSILESIARYFSTNHLSSPTADQDLLNVLYRNYTTYLLSQSSTWCEETALTKNKFQECSMIHLGHGAWAKNLLYLL